MPSHHRHHKPATTIYQRPFILRTLSILGLLLPIALFAVSLAFTIKTILDPSFAVALVLDDNDAITYRANSSPPYTQKASLFYSCTSYPLGTPLLSVANTTQTCSRLATPFGKAGMRNCLGLNSYRNHGDPHLCQQIVTGAGLYLSGAVLVGAALLIALISLLLDWSTAAARTTLASAHGYAPVSTGQNHSTYDTGTERFTNKDAQTRYSEYDTNVIPENNSEATLPLKPILCQLLLASGILFASAAAACLLIAQYLAFNALVEDQKPDGDISISGQSVVDPGQSPWYLGTAGLVYATLAWLAAAVGAFVAAAYGCLGMGEG